MLPLVMTSECACGQAICAFVEEHRPAALAIMRENKGAVTRFFMGSVSRYCAEHSAVPVIVVPSS
jgi:nucleotide-binding universal stress UspA family protein